MITKKDLTKAYDTVNKKYQAAKKDEVSIEELKYMEGELNVLMWALEQYK